MSLTICHDWHDGTTLYGTEKNSAAHRIAKEARSWMWRGGQKVWGVRSSKRQAPKQSVINAMAAELREAGYTVECEIDETVPGIDEREQVEEQRWDAITERHDRQASKLHSEGQADIDKADQFYQQLPFGQPILVGHHSEKADRNRRAREARRLHRGFERQNAAATRQAKANQAAAHMGARYSPETVGNRITKLEAEERALLVDLDGGKPRWHQPTNDVRDSWFGKAQPPEGEARDRLTTELDRVREDLDWWRQVRAEHVETGRAVDPSQIAKGDWVKVWGDWVPVRRVNKKTVTTPHPMGDWDPATVYGGLGGRKEWQVTQLFHKLEGHCKDMPQHMAFKLDMRRARELE